MDGLSERKMQILRAVIEAYIVNGEPVGSKYLTAQGQITFSSATIRNEMAELEALGYLEQPHTSAGRVPSELGYRFYVDQLMQSYRMTADELRKLNSLMRSKVAELDSILDQAASLAANITNYTALTVRKPPSETVIIHFKVIRLGSDVFLLIMVTAAESVVTKYIHIEGGVSDEGIDKLEHAINELVCGKELDSITLPVMIKLQKELAGYEYLIAPVMKSMYEAVADSDGGDIKLEGVNRLLRYPELCDIERLSGLLGLFERKEDIFEVVSRSDKDMVNVFIGRENKMDIMRHATFVFRTITSGRNVVGAIGVIGPCRMDYSRVVTTVEYLSKAITRMMENGSPEDVNPTDGQENNGGSDKNE